MFQQGLKLKCLYVCACLSALFLGGCASNAPLVGNDPWQDVTVQLKTEEGVAVLGAECQLANSESVASVKSGETVRVRRSDSDLFVKCSNGSSHIALAQARSGVVSNPYQRSLIASAIPIVGLVNAVTDSNRGAYLEYPNTLNLILNKTYLFQGGHSKLALVPGIVGMMASKNSGEGVLSAEGQSYEDLTKNIDYIFNPNEHGRIRIINENLVAYALVREKACFPKKGIMSDQAGRDRVSHGGTWITSTNKTIGMPMTQPAPASFSEHLIKGGKPLTLEVSFAHENAIERQYCAVATSFIPKVNGSYEVRFIRDYAKKECQVSVNELLGESPNLSIAKVDLNSAHECEAPK